MAKRAGGSSRGRGRSKLAGSKITGSVKGVGGSTGATYGGSASTKRAGDMRKRGK